jgi:hypothetical protein
MSLGRVQAQSRDSKSYLFKSRNPILAILKQVHSVIRCRKCRTTHLLAVSDATLCEDSTTHVTE